MKVKLLTRICLVLALSCAPCTLMAQWSGGHRGPGGHGRNDGSGFPENPGRYDYPRRPDLSGCALEFSVGCSSIFSRNAAKDLSQQFGSQGIWRREEDRETGSDVRRIPNLSLAFRWEVSLISDIVLLASFGALAYTPSHYTSWNTDGHYPEGGYWTSPVQDPRKMKLTDASLTAVWRINWFYLGNVHFYSSLGAGFDFTEVLPIPYLSPFGICIGEHRRVYGFFEANVSGAAFLALGGVGIRL